MAKDKLKNLKPFKPGQSGNPSGKPKDLLTTAKVQAVMGKFANMTREQLQAVVTNPKSTMLDIMVASVMVKAAKDGDYARFNFLLDRQIGKVKDQLEVSTPEPFIVKRKNGEEIEAGMALPEKEEG